MAQQERLLIPSDLTASTSFYEVWFRVSGSSVWSRQTFASPLPLYVTVSPAASTPNIILTPLPNSTLYEYQVRRFDLNNNPSNWVTGTFTTGS